LFNHGVLGIESQCEQFERTFGDAHGRRLLIGQNTYYGPIQISDVYMVGTYLCPEILLGLPTYIYFKFKHTKSLSDFHFLIPLSPQAFEFKFSVTYFIIFKLSASVWQFARPSSSSMPVYLGAIHQVFLILAEFLVPDLLGF